MLGLKPGLPAAGGLAALLTVRGRVRLVVPAHFLLVRLVIGRVGFDLPQAEVRADWTLTSPDAGAICGQAWSSDMHDYCTGCGVLLNEDCESAVPGWCVWCAGEE